MLSEGMYPLQWLENTPLVQVQAPLDLEGNAKPGKCCMQGSQGRLAPIETSVEEKSWPRARPDELLSDGSWANPSRLLCSLNSVTIKLNSLIMNS